MSSFIDRIQTSIWMFRMKYGCVDLRGKAKKYTCGALKCCSAGGTKEIGPCTFTYGRTNQSFMFGLYAGLQCTSMALTAIIQHKIYSELTPRRINKILKEGNKLHTRLREEICLSDNEDKKVAVEDFPHEFYLHLGKVFERNTFVRLRENCQNVFTTEREDYPGFLTIREYVDCWCIKVCLRKVEFLLTINEFSYSILVNKNGEVQLFDSHGHLKYKGELIKEKAGVMKFPSTVELEEFLVGMYGTERHAVIAPVSISFKKKATQVEKVEKRREQVKEELYQPLLLATEDTVIEKLEVKAMEYEYDESPFVGMLGGGY